MAEVVTLHQRPLEGALGVIKPSVEVTTGGMVGDQTYILYDDDHDIEEPRKQVIHHPKLAAACAYSLHNNTALRVSFGSDKTVCEVPELTQVEKLDNRVLINAGGEDVEAIDQGDEAADFFAARLDFPSLRLARKTNSWLNPTLDEVKKRRRAPLRIASLEDMMTLLPEELDDPAGVCPNIIFDDDSNLLEAYGKPGTLIKIGSLVLWMGESASPDGTYGIYPLLSRQVTHTINKGDKVELKV